MANKPKPRSRQLSVYLYIPNIIGYIRILLNCYAFARCFSSKRLFAVLYFLSFVCDALDGWCARKFNQASTFGAVLDMMYSTFLVGKASHKDVKDSSSWLFKLYYGNRMFMGFCCVACEVLYITLFLIAKNHTENLMDVIVTTLKQGSPLSFLVALSLLGCSIKQVINFIQMKTAADACVLYDTEKKQKP
ncbi:CDP-diacylglycerol--inositol 3-phosphatidyltransferase 1 isoform X2 [Herrania umbratica]|uniref:CDP-diacylglycerol--inositol 3-phosphatidyltransferase n=1 Tax=Herrania umbratica TaxID=108875 RepID=A0A6J1AH41_9ROSI|nr:CDP-diacylglycerol--inositol 3-phosphatidyltransferase 1 isoform X2 [Herrania umbratica]